jgi:hypothetical protein
MDKWFKPLILIFAAIFLIVFYLYSENGRYTYHKEIGELINNKYIVDTRSGIIYGEVDTSVGQSNFYEKNLKTGLILLKPHKIINNIYKEPPKSSKKEN